MQGFVVLRRIGHGLWRALICEPYFKAHCRQYGDRVHTGTYLHWINGAGDLIVGDDVTFDGKISVRFAHRFGRPALVVGNRTGLGHGCHLAVAKRIEIGSDCRIAANVRIFDSHGHPSDPERRRRGDPPDAESVKPVVIEDNVWIGTGSYVFPGVRIGTGSIVSAGSVVLSDIPPYTVVAGNPARKIGTLAAPESGSPSKDEGRVDVSN
ncbi:MAG: acyltransferase [Gemmatimonadales bacterium]